MGIGPSEQLPSIALHSPLSLIGGFIYIIRQRFDPDYNLPWKWCENPADSSILIEAQYEPNTEQRDVKPAIVLDRDQVSFGKIVLANYDTDQPQIIEKRHERFRCLAQCDLLIDCISTVKGESAQLGDLIQTYLQMSARPIMASFALKDMSPIILGRTLPYGKEVNLYNSQITFRVEWEPRWETAPVAPILRKLGLFLENSTDPVNATLTKYYLDSLLKP